jgi:osmotically-inducible protein OsmY
METRDSAIQQSVLRELKWDTRVDETDVGVEVDSGVVTLTGTVDSWAKRVAAQEAAHRVAGVLDVANDIEVRVPGTPGRTDTQIAGAVRLALEWDVYVPEERIRTTVSEGWVMLEGDVDTWSEREDAERSIKNLAGVRGITNKIEVRSRAVRADEIQKSIHDAITRHAEREARHVDVAVRDDRVIVSGTVNSWAERATVLGAVKGTQGVGRVEDRLRIEPRTA